MANEMHVQFTGGVGKDPEIRHVGDKRVLSLSLVHSARVKQGDQHVDSAPMWMDASLWERWPGDRRVDNVYASLQKGSRVDVVGKLRLEEYTGRNGSGVSTRLQIESIAPNLDFATAAPVKNERGGGQAASGGSGWGQAQGQQGWAAAQPQQQGGGWPAAQPAPAPAAQPATAAAPAPQELGGFDDEQPF